MIPLESRHPVRVLVVDDSALMRRTFCRLLEEEPGLEVVGIARDGLEAVEKARDLRPDVVTMDLNMPRMDGLSALQMILEEELAQVLVVSSLSREGALVTFEALELGAFDCVEKPGGTISRSLETVRDELVSKIRAAAASRPRRGELRTPRSSPAPKKIAPKGVAPFSAVALGISTGGPRTIYDVLPHLPGDLNAAVFVVQHMPPHFTGMYAERLDASCALRVVEAERGMVVTPGVVYVGRGGYQLCVDRRGDEIKLSLPSQPRSTFIPSVNVMMHSVREAFGPRTVGVLMTGMGDDGAEGMGAIRHSGGYGIVESEETAVVFGMPAEALRRGGADVALPSYRIAAKIVEVVKKL